MRKAEDRPEDDSNWYQVEYTAPDYQGGVCAACGAEYEVSEEDEDVPFCEDCLSADVGDDDYDELGWGD